MLNLLINPKLCAFRLWSLAQWTNADGQAIGYAYDHLQRETGETWYNASSSVVGTVSYGYLCSCQHPGAEFFGLACPRASQGTGRCSFSHSSMAA